MCTTNEGRGKDHRWTIWVGYGRIISVSTTSYGRPVIEQINLFSPSLDTKGVKVEIIGKNLAHLHQPGMDVLDEKRCSTFDNRGYSKNGRRTSW